MTRSTITLSKRKEKVTMKDALTLLNADCVAYEFGLLKAIKGNRYFLVNPQTGGIVGEGLLPPEISKGDK